MNAAFLNFRRRCPVCGGNRGSFLHRQRFMLPVGHPLTSGYDVVCCGQCGFVYADIAATQTEYDQFYAQHSIYQSDLSSGGGETPWDAKRLAETALYIDRFITEKTGRILDVGCANGGLLKAFRQLQYVNLHGIDPSPACVENTRAYGFTATQGCLGRNLSDLGRFDVVCLSHVLEHVLDMDIAVEAVLTLVNPGGMCYVETPDVLRYAPFLKAPFQDFNTEHINHFSTVALVQTFQLRSGWKVVDVGTKEILSSPGNPFPVCYALLQRDERITVPDCPARMSDLKLAVKDYIDLSNQLLVKIEANLKANLAPQMGFLVWGTGQLCMKLLVETSLSEANILSFVDGNAINWGQALKGISIKSPLDITDTHQPILIASLLNQAQIENDIRQKWKLTNPIIHLL